MKKRRIYMRPAYGRILPKVPVCVTPGLDKSPGSEKMIVNVDMLRE